MKTEDDDIMLDDESAINAIVDILKQIYDILKVHEMRIDDAEYYILEQIENTLSDE